MRVPVPTNRLVALTLLGALATAVVASAIVVPGVVGMGEDSTDRAATAAPGGDAPQPNENFTPAVANRGGGEHEEYEEYEEHQEEEEYEEEEHDEHEEEAED